MPSVNDGFLVEMAGKAQHTAMIGRSAKTASSILSVSISIRPV